MALDFIDNVKQFAKKAENVAPNISNEEATKTSLIMPFFQMLGYDIFDPSEFVPEFTADQGIKKGEKVDYAIKINGVPAILIEAKAINEKLDVNYESQLFRYFTATKARFAILTNGIIYRFFTDLESPNIMDKDSFLDFDLLDLKDNKIGELKKFTKSNFDPENILNSASRLKYSTKIISLLTKEMQTPSESFKNYILNEVYEGKKTQQVKDKFTDIIKTAFNQFINDLINEKIKVAFSSAETEKVEEEPVAPVDTLSQIVTSQTELEAYFIVKSILRDVVPLQDIVYKDTKTYFGILYQNNTRKWICRLSLDGNKKYLVYPNEDKAEVRQELSSIDDIYIYKDQISEVVQRYISPSVG